MRARVALTLLVAVLVSSLTVEPNVASAQFWKPPGNAAESWSWSVPKDQFSAASIRALQEITRVEAAGAALGTVLIGATAISLMPTSVESLPSALGTATGIDLHTRAIEGVNALTRHRLEQIVTLRRLQAGGPSASPWKTRLDRLFFAELSRRIQGLQTEPRSSSPRSTAGLSVSPTSTLSSRPFHSPPPSLTPSRANDPAALPDRTASRQVTLTREDALALGALALQAFGLGHPDARLRPPADARGPAPWRSSRDDLLRDFSATPGHANTLRPHGQRHKETQRSPATESATGSDTWVQTGHTPTLPAQGAETPRNPDLFAPYLFRSPGFAPNSLLGATALPPSVISGTISLSPATYLRLYPQAPEADFVSPPSAPFPVVDSVTVDDQGNVVSLQCAAYYSLFVDDSLPLHSCLQP